MHQAGFCQERKVFSMYEMHAESRFQCDYLTSRNGFCKCIMASMAESKRVLKISNCTKNEDEHTNPLYTSIVNIYGLVLWHINPCGLFNARSSLYIYI